MHGLLLPFGVYLLSFCMHRLLRLNAATISAASLSAIDFPERLRAKKIMFLMLIETFRSGRISIGTWKLAPPTLRLFTSTAGVIFSSAFFQTSSGTTSVSFTRFSPCSRDRKI